MLRTSGRDLDTGGLSADQFMSQEIGDRSGEGTTLNNISQIYRQLYDGQAIEINKLIPWLRLNISEEYYALAQ